MRRGPGLSQIPNDLPPGGPLPLSCSFGSEARGGHGNVGPASRVPMTTGSPSGGAGAHQRVPIKACRWRTLGEGPGGKSGSGAAPAAGWPPHFRSPPPGAAVPARPVPFAYLRVTACARPPPTTGSPLLGGAALLLGVPRLVPASRPRPTHFPGTRDVPANTLGLAPRPRKCRAAAKPRPCPCCWNCPEAPPGACSLSSGLPPSPPGIDGDISLAASPSRDTSPRLLGCP